MNKTMILICILMICVLAGCSRNPGADKTGEKSGMTFGEDITEDKISKFYYTIENINYDAYYLRYLFYVEDGKHMFFFEERERKNEYGPTTEEDTIAKAEFELSGDEWSDFIRIISGGQVRERQENEESGGSGPWTYLYWIGDKDRYQEYSFESQSTRKEFETLCETLVAKGSPEKKKEKEQERINTEAGKAFEKFVKDELTEVSSRNRSFVTVNDGDGEYSTDYPQELFGVISHCASDIDGDGLDELIICSLSNDDIYENLLISAYEYDEKTGSVEIADVYEYGENLLESDDGNTFVYTYEYNGRPVIGISTMEIYNTRGDAVNLVFRALSYDSTGFSELGADEYCGSDMEDTGFADTMKSCGVDIEWVEFFENDIKKVQENIIYACDGNLISEIITKTDDVEYDGEGYIAEKIYRHADVYGYETEGKK